MGKKVSILDGIPSREELKEKLKTNKGFVRLGKYFTATSDEMVDARYDILEKWDREGLPQSTPAPVTSEAAPKGTDTALLARLEALETSAGQVRAAHDQLVDAHEKLQSEHDALKASIGGAAVIAQGEAQKPAEAEKAPATATAK